MGIADMGEVHYENIMDPTLFTNPDDPAVLGSSLAEIYPCDLLEGDFADAPQADATFDLDDFKFDFDKQATRAVDSGFAMPNSPQSLFRDQRYVSLPQSQTHPTSVWRPLEQPVEQFIYPDPEVVCADFSSQMPTLSTHYYPPQLVSPATTMTQQNFRAITPPGQQLSSIDQPLFLDNCLAQPPAVAGLYPYDTIPPYQDNGAFLPEDLALSPIPEELLATAIFERWPLPPNTTAQKRSHPDDLYIPNPRNNDSDADLSDADFHPSRPTKKVRRTRLSRPHTILPNGEVKKGRPCAKPQTEERKRINQRRMEGYYRRKHEQGNLEKTRTQSKESYWRRKQRRIEAGEKVRSYNASNNKQGGRKA